MNTYTSPSGTKSLFKLLTLCCAIVVTACKPRPTPPPPPPVNTSANGIYILNEGLFQMNNSTISYYDFTTQTMTDNIFLQVNNRGLGDTGNDLQAYGSKLYCVVNNSNRLEVMDLETAKSIKAIELPNKSPRHIAFYQDKAYVSCFDGDVVRIDTASLVIEKVVHSGNNPEGLCVCNGKLYVANSGGLNYPNYDNTISVFDVSTLSLQHIITIGINPFKVETDGQYVYACTRGDYGSSPGQLFRINTQNDQVCQTWNNIQNFTISGGKAYVYDVQYKSGNTIRVIDLNNANDSGHDFITDGTHIQMPYGITVNPLNGDVYITDAYNFTVTGDVYCFNKEGKKQFSISAGLNPNSIVFKTNISQAEK